MSKKLIERFNRYYWPFMKTFLSMLILVVAISIFGSIMGYKNIEFDLVKFLQSLCALVVLTFVTGGTIQLIFEVIVPWRDNSIFKKSILKKINIENFKNEDNSLVGIYNGYQFTILPNAGSEKGESVRIICSIDIRRSEINWLTEELKSYEVLQADGFYFVQKEVSLLNKNQVTSVNFTNIMNEISTSLIAKNVPPIID